MACGKRWQAAAETGTLFNSIGPEQDRAVQPGGGEGFGPSVSFWNGWAFRPEETAAFGDADNDIDMLKVSGCGIAVANATEGCKAAADCLTKSNQEDGVAYGIREILGIRAGGSDTTRA